MKKILLFLMAAAMLAACSAPKYTYYFDRYPANNTTAMIKKKADVKLEEVVYEKVASSTPELITPTASIAQDHTVLASASKRILAQPNKKVLTIDKDSKSTLLKISKKEKKALVKSTKEYRATKMISPNAVKEGDKTKNGFAIAGFVSSLVGLFVAPFVFCTVGIVMSAIGMKSEKRKMAIAGLVIGIVGLALILIIGAALI